MQRLPLTPIAAAMLASACAPAVRLETPPPVVATQWSTDVAEEGAAVIPLAASLGSPELDALIAQAMRTSPALLAAGERLEEARALARSARHAGMPVVGASAYTSGGRNAFDFGSSSASLEASFTPDLGGGRRAGRRAANARAQAAAGDRAAQERRATAEIARTFVQRAALARRLALVDRSIAQSAELERIVGLRAREGDASRVEVGLQAIRSRRLVAERLRLTGALDQSRAALALLVGAEAPGFAAIPADLAAITPPRLVAPAPARLAQSRPDLQAAEARLRAAGGDVGVARAAFFPSLTLSTGQAAQAVATGGTSLGASLLLPIFNRGAIRGDFDAASARQRAAVLDYRQAVLAALADVDAALGSARTSQAREAAIDDMAAQARLTAGLARRRYLEGEAGLQELLDAQDLLISSDDAGALAREERLAAAIALWLAAGGS